MYRRIVLALLGAVLVAGVSPLTLAADSGDTTPASGIIELIMVEETGCVWCARWNAEIAPVYPKTPEGKAAPLRRIDIRTPLPPDLDLASPPVFTPTFILVNDGKELARIEGYPGEDFFWGLLGILLTRHTDFTEAT